VKARSALALTLAVGVWGCGGNDGIGPPPPPPNAPGALTFDVTTPADLEDGALLITVSGGPVDSVSGMGTYEVFHTVTATGARAMIFGAIGDGPLMRVWVPDLSQAAAYGVQVEEGAVRGTYAIVEAGSYTVTRRP
jgi:hypothetical protein